MFGQDAMGGRLEAPSSWWVPETSSEWSWCRLICALMNEQESPGRGWQGHSRERAWCRTSQQETILWLECRVWTLGQNLGWQSLSSFSFQGDLVQEWYLLGCGPQLARSLCPQGQYVLSRWFFVGWSFCLEESLFLIPSNSYYYL